MSKVHKQIQGNVECLNGGEVGGGVSHWQAHTNYMYIDKHTQECLTHSYIIVKCITMAQYIERERKK